MPDICNLIGQKSMLISDIFYFYRENINGMTKIAKHGKDYEPSSLAAMESSIDRYLRELNYEYSILNSRFFKGSRDVLEGKAHLLCEKGLGKKPNKTNSLTRQEEDILWECGQLGDKTPKSIIATLWWQFSRNILGCGGDKNIAS